MTGKTDYLTLMFRSFYFIAFLSIFCFTGCRVSEELFINPDGSGTEKLVIDGSMIFSAFGDEMFSSAGDDMDTVIVFKELIQTLESKNSLNKLDKDILESLYDVTYISQINKEKELFLIEIQKKFSSVDSIGDIFQVFTNIGKLGIDTDIHNQAPDISDFIEVKYSFHNKKFTREVSILDQEGLDLLKEEMEMTSFFSDIFNSDISISFPAKIKKVSLKRREYRLNRDKTKISIPIEVNQLILDPLSTQFEIRIK